MQLLFLYTTNTFVKLSLLYYYSFLEIHYIDKTAREDSLLR